MRDFATKYHNQFADAMLAYEGHVLMTKEIIKILIQKFPDLWKMEDWLQPPDHCKNHTNNGACYCATSENALFEQLGRGKYRVLLAKHLP
jgi:hypothetical protein